MSESTFYDMPFITEQLGRKSGFLRCNLATSVRQNLRLLLVTPPGRCRFDPYYGCRIHLSQFLVDNRAMEGRKIEDRFKQQMEANIEELIIRFEPRLDLKEVSVEVKQKPEEQKPWKKGSIPLHRNVIQVLVMVKGSIKPAFAQGKTLEIEDMIPLL